MGWEGGNGLGDGACFLPCSGITAVVEAPPRPAVISRVAALSFGKRMYVGRGCHGVCAVCLLFVSAGLIASTEGEGVVCRDCVISRESKARGA